MDLRGFNKFSLVDYPGKIGCILFTGGCNFCCPFCHNPCLVFDPGSQPRVTEPEVFHFLEKRRNLLEGVVISGGEPTLQADLLEFVRRIKAMGFLVKVDSNGSMPERVKVLLDSGLVDAMGIDYKAPAARYMTSSGSVDSAIAEKVAESIRYALAAGIQLDIRTTVHRRLLSPEDLATMYRELKALGVSGWTLQQFNPVEVIDDALPAAETYSDRELVVLANSLGPEVRVRGIHGRILV